MTFNEAGDSLANAVFGLVGSDWFQFRLEAQPALPPEDVSGSWIAVGISPATIEREVMGSDSWRAAELQVVVGSPHEDFRMANAALDLVIDALQKYNRPSDWPNGFLYEGPVELSNDAEEYGFEFDPGSWRVVVLKTQVSWAKEQ